VVGVVLGVVAGLKAPQGVLLQVTDQVTPAFWLSLATVAAIPTVAEGAIEPGGVKPVVNVTAMGTTEDLCVPQAVRTRTKIMAVRAKVGMNPASVNLANFIKVSDGPQPWREKSERTRQSIETSQSSMLITPFAITPSLSLNCKILVAFPTESA
jgi:hypothetical protein